MLSVSGLQHANCGPTGLGPVTFEIRRGTCVAIVGASGPGKSLLLRAINDLDVSEGTIRLDGMDRESISATEWRARRLARGRARLVGRYRRRAFPGLVGYARDHRASRFRPASRARPASPAVG